MIYLLKLISFTFLIRLEKFMGQANSIYLPKYLEISCGYKEELKHVKVLWTEANWKISITVT